MALAAGAALAIFAVGLHPAHHLPQLQFGHFSGRHVAMPLRIPVRWSCDAPVSYLRHAPPNGALLRVRRDGEITRTMKLTARRLRFYQFLRAALWVSTSQVHRLYFPHATIDATRKWLRAAVHERHIAAFQANRMSEALFTLGPEGKRVLEQRGATDVRLERVPPKQLAHLSGVNDIRIAAELSGSLAYFFSYWQLPALGWPHAIIPDAVFELAGRTFAAEFDRGLEGVKFFLRTKIAMYEQGFEGLPLSALVVVADRRARMERLAQAVAGSKRPIFFSTLDEVRRNDFAGPIFWRFGNEGPIRLL